MTGSTIRKSKRPATDAFGAPIARERTAMKDPAQPPTSAFKRAVDRFARTISGREKPEW